VSHSKKQLQVTAENSIMFTKSSPNITGLVKSRRRNRPASRRYPYFDAAVGLVWSKDPKSYVGASVPTGKVSHVGQVKGDDPDEKRFFGNAGLGLGVRPSSTRKKVYVEKPPKFHRMGLIKRIRSGHTYFLHGAESFLSS